MGDIIHPIPGFCDPPRPTAEQKWKWKWSGKGNGNGKPSSRIALATSCFMTAMLQQKKFKSRSDISVIRRPRRKREGRFPN
jgi:hypothetical protein